MTPMLFDDLERDEGLRLRAYQDTVGRWTIGYGHAEGVVEGEIWSRNKAQATLNADVGRSVAQLDKALPWWRALDDVRQDALAEMCFNMGIGTLSDFVHALKYLRSGDWANASAAFLLSKWASQVGHRAQRLAFMVRNGARPTS